MTTVALEQMVMQQVRAWDVLEDRVLDTLRKVPRERFVPRDFRAVAYADAPIPLPHGQHMLTPQLIGRILQAIDATPTESVLEVGTGSGYMAALLGAHADHVWSVEIDPQLAETARENLRRAGVTNVAVEVGNGLEGLAAHAPYDAIMVSGAVPVVPEALLEQLKPGGRLFAIEGAAPAMEAVLYTRAGDGFRRVAVFETVVPPLLAAAPAPAFAF